MKPHHVYADHEDTDDPRQPGNRYIASVHPASHESVLIVSAATRGDPDGRSEFMWVRLANGDLILGVYPQGETYFAVEGDAQYPVGAA